MKNTIRNLIIALPLATAAFTLVPAAAAQAEVGPVIVLPPADPHPEPEEPKDKGIPMPEPEEPKDKGIPMPEPEEPEDGPGELTSPDPCPTHGVDCTPDDDEPNGGNGGGGGKGDEVIDSITLPTRIDAGLASEEQGGLDLTWLVVGGAVVTATGVGFAARNRARGNA